MGLTKSKRIGLTLVINWVELDFFSTRIRWVKLKKINNQPELYAPLRVQISVIYSKAQTVVQYFFGTTLFM